MGVSATLEARFLAVDPGADVSVRVGVQNTGQVVDQFAIEVLGEAAAWVTVEPPVLSLFPGRDDAVTIRFRPPRVAGTRAGEIPFGVRVTSREDPAGSTVEEGVVTVGEFHDAGADVVPRNSRGRRSATYEIAVDNRGNSLLRAALDAADADDVLRFHFSPNAVEVPPGRAAFARLRARPRRVFLSGPPRSHPFQLQVATEGQAPIRIDAAMIQEALFATWVRRAALIALAAIVAGALLWFLALKPAVESAAKGAVAAPLAQQSAAIAALQKQQPPTGGGAGSPSPSPGTGGSAGAPGFARRLTVGSPQYKVPGGTALYITDIVFQNPNGEQGTISLQRDGSSLLVENLANFRDLDFHFVTPINANANQTIQLAVSCGGAGCPGAGLYVNGYTRPM